MKKFIKWLTQKLSWLWHSDIPKKPDGSGFGDPVDFDLSNPSPIDKRIFLDNNE